MNVNTLLEMAKRNEQSLKRLQAFELQLLASHNWFELLDNILNKLTDQFDLDGVSLKLADPTGDLKFSISQSLDLDQGHVLNNVDFFPSLPDMSVTTEQTPPRPWASCLTLPLEYQDEVTGHLYLLSNDKERFTPGMATDFMEHLAAVTAACFFMVRQSEERSRLLLSDPLTGAENRRGFERSYLRAQAQIRRDQRRFTLVMLDLDHFKQINDRHGHGTGDRVLKALIEQVKSTLRPTDHIGRLGGEEFAIILSGGDASQLSHVVQRLRATIHAMQVFNDESERVPVTASGSFMTLGDGDTLGLSLDDALSRLDVVLYEAKNQGRDRFLAVT